MYNRQKVVDYALQQVGHEYQWLGTGPAFDCSGLTLMSWQQVGLALPHNSAAQAKLLKAVEPTVENKEQLQLGDLIFYYGSVKKPASISHVAIYVGRGGKKGLKYMIVQATDEAHGVEELHMNQYLSPSGFGFIR